MSDQRKQIVWKVTSRASKANEEGERNYYSIGSIVLHDDGTGLLRLNMFPDQQFFLFKKPERSLESPERDRHVSSRGRNRAISRGYEEAEK